MVTRSRRLLVLSSSRLLLLPSGRGLPRRLKAVSEMEGISALRGASRIGPPRRRRRPSSLPLLNSGRGLLHPKMDALAAMVVSEGIGAETE